MDRKFLPWAFGLAPVALFLQTWFGQPGHLASFSQSYALPVVVVEVTTILAALIRGMRLPFRPAGLMICVAGLIVIAWTTALFVAPIPLPATLLTALWMIHLLFGFSVAYLAPRSFDTVELATGLLVGFALYAGFLLVFALTIEDPLHFSWSDGLPGLGNIRRIGFYCAAIIGLCLGLFAKGSRWAVAACSLAFALVFWTGSRGAVFAVLFGLAVCMIFLPVVRERRVWGRLAICLMIGALAGCAFLAVVPTSGVGGVARIELSNRIAIWLDVIRLIPERPWFGYGEGQTRHLLDRPGIFQPHNIFLQIVLAWGFVGATLLTISATWTGVRLIRSQEEQTIPFLCSVIFLGGASLVDGALYNCHPLSIAAACIGACFAAGRKSRAGAEDEWGPRSIEAVEAQH